MSKSNGSDKDQIVPGPGKGNHPNSRANLIEYKKGNNANPLGHNQYTYKENTEKYFEAQCAKRIEKVLKAAFDRAEDGSAADAKLILERAMPAVSKHEVQATIEPDSPQYLPSAEKQAELEALLAGDGKTLH